MSDPAPPCACETCRLRHAVKLLRALVRTLAKKLDELEPEPTPGADPEPDPRPAPAMDA